MARPDANLRDYTATAADWRASLRMNSRRTGFVIGLFFLIYASLGLLVDLLLLSSTYPNATIDQLLQLLYTSQVTPTATLVMLAVAAISIMVTFSMSNQLMLLGTEYEEVTADSPTPTAKQLYHIVEEMKIAAGLRFMPRVFIIQADYMNAFASGYSEKSAMVAITWGLLQKLNRAELQAVMAHEISHIRHMDIKLTLLASVLANLMLIVIDIVFRVVLYSRDDERDESRNKLVPFVLMLRFVLPVINVLLLLYLSRRREFMADAGSVELLRDNQPLASALLKIAGDHADNKATYAQAYAKTPHENVRREAYIFDPVQVGIEPMLSLADMFSSHPSLKDRLAAIGYKQNSS